MLKFLRFLIAAFAALSSLFLPTFSMADDDKEALVKAAFIYNFVKFVEWPDGKAINKQSSIDICTFGSGGISRTGAVFRQASTPALTLRLVEEKNWQNAASHCHVLFISSAEESVLPDILATLKGRSVLTVSDIDGFAERGGMIGFVMSDNKIKLVVHPKVISAAGMRVDAQLLEIALKVVDR